MTTEGTSIKSQIHKYQCHLPGKFKCTFPECKFIGVHTECALHRQLAIAHYTRHRQIFECKQQVTKLSKVGNHELECTKMGGQFDELSESINAFFNSPFNSFPSSSFNSLLNSRFNTFPNLSLNYLALNLFLNSTFNSFPNSSFNSFPNSYLTSLHNLYAQKHRHKFTLNGEQQHSTISQPTLICQHCPYSTVSAAHLKSHQRVHSDHKPYKCKWIGCGYAAKRKGNALIHIRAHLTNSPSQVSNPNIYLEVIPVSFGLQGLTNARVNFEENELKTGKAPNVKQSETKTKIASEHQSNESKMNTRFTRCITEHLQCTACSFKFPTQDQLNQHRLTVHSIGPFRCLVKDCGRSFDYEPSRREHIKQAHPSQVHCVECGRQFVTYRQLYLHNYGAHQRGQFRCSFPGCGFRRPDRNRVYYHYAQQHKQIHTCQHNAKII